MAVGHGPQDAQKTMGIIELDPPHGFAAELTASSVLYATSSLLPAPISTTHVITTSIMGVGSTRRRSAVRWGVAGNIAVAWLLTLPIAAALAAASYLALHAIIAL